MEGVRNMSEFEEMVAALATAAASVQKMEEGDYVGDDGLIYCGKCNTPRQCKIEIGGKMLTTSCLCRCRQEEYEAEDAARKKEQAFYKIQSMRSEGIQDKVFLTASFADAELTPAMKSCKKYADNFEKIKPTGSGLLMWGEPGTGKTFAAACIANELIDRQIPVLMTSIPRILNSAYDKNDLIRQIRKYPLLIIDDLGAERETEYSLEMVYYVIDERYKSGLPMIITTNLQLADLQDAKDIEYKRIYDRVLEVCTPMGFKGKQFRKEKRESRREEVKRIMLETGIISGEE